MMSPLAALVISGIVALVVTVIISIVMIRGRLDGAARFGWRNSLSILCGLGAGLLVMAALASSYVPGDRFYTMADAMRILAATAAGCVLIWCVDVAAPRGPGRFWTRVYAYLGIEIVAAILLVWAGVRFELMKVPGEGVAQLNSMESHVLTVCWLVVAMNLIRLLDGIHGAAGIAVLVAGITALFSNLVYDEFFLTGVSLVAIGCAAGSLWFCSSRKRLPLEGSGTAILGFLFATLTVLARQKTVATGLLAIPLVLIFLVAGAAMMGLLEKRLLLPKDDE